MERELDIKLMPIQHRNRPGGDGSVSRYSISVDAVIVLTMFYCRSIAACRLVTRLQDFRNQDVYIGEDYGGGNSKDRQGRGSRPISAPMFRRSPAGISQIRVTTSHIVMEDM